MSFVITNDEVPANDVDPSTMNHTYPSIYGCGASAESLVAYIDGRPPPTLERALKVKLCSLQYISQPLFSVT